MEESEAVMPALVQDEVRKPMSQEMDATQDNRHGRNKGLIYFVISFQVVLLGACAVLALATIDGFERLNERMDTQFQDARALQHEITGIRQVLASNSGEEVIFLKIMIIRPELDRELAREVARHVRSYSNMFGQDPDLVLSIIAVESAFNPAAVSSKGAEGLMQVMPQWKRILGITGDLQDIETSIKYGMQIFGFYNEMYKDIEIALTAYNRGPGPVDVALMRGQDPKNDYAPRVLKTYEQLRTLRSAKGS